MTLQTPTEPLPSYTPLQPITLAWALRRTALAIAILSVVIGSMAWLTYASIDPTLENEAQSLEAPADATPPVTKVNIQL